MGKTAWSFIFFVSSSFYVIILLFLIQETTGFDYENLGNYTPDLLLSITDRITYPCNSIVFFDCLGSLMITAIPAYFFAKILIKLTFYILPAYAKKQCDNAGYFFALTGIAIAMLIMTVPFMCTLFFDFPSVFLAYGSTLYFVMFKILIMSLVVSVWCTIKIKQTIIDDNVHH